MRLSAFVGQDAAKLGLVLNAVDPRCGGLLLVGGKGTGKSTLARLSRGLLPTGAPFVELPLHVTEDSLLGGCDLEETLRCGERVPQPSLLSRAHGGVIFIDDVNLLGSHSLTLLLEAHDRGAELLSWDGRTEPRECRFMLLATMNPEEGDLSPHAADRFGLCAVMQEIASSGERQQILRLADSQAAFAVEPDPPLLDRIATARSLLPRVQVPQESLEHLVALVEQNGCRGHRGDLSLLYAGRAYAAFRGETVVTPDHLNRVGELVFAHRRPAARDEEPTATGERQAEDRQDDAQAERHEDRRQPDGSAQQPSERSQEASASDGREAITIPREATACEEIMDVGEPFKVRRLLFRKDRRKRRGDGRRTRTHIAGRDGWPVKTALRSSERDIALGATIRACAPFQTARGRIDRLLIGHDDLRFHRREGRMGHLVVFVVDGSGSMGAQRRMVAAKGAIQALLLDCYQKRDRVAMIVFRKDRAELVLPPTTSVELAAKQLATLPVGGKTPLAAGLLETYRLVQRVVRRHPETRILAVLVTDGRGNHSLGGDPHAELRGLTRLLAEQPQCDFLVIDTENKRNAIRTDLARTLAQQLAAEYHTIETLQAEHLAALVQSHTAAG